MFLNKHLQFSALPWSCISDRVSVRVLVPLANADCCHLALPGCVPGQGPGMREGFLFVLVVLICSVAVYLWVIFKFLSIGVFFFTASHFLMFAACRHACWCACAAWVCPLFLSCLTCHMIGGCCGWWVGWFCCVCLWVRVLNFRCGGCLRLEFCILLKRFENYFCQLHICIISLELLYIYWWA